MGFFLGKQQGEGDTERGTEIYIYIYMKKNQM